MTKLIFIEEINLKESPIVRCNVIHKEIVEQYAENYTDKREMPPIVVFFDIDKKTYYLADGRHRCEAVRTIGRKAIPAIVHEGDFDDALKFAIKSNSSHGLPRTNADKRLCVEKALKRWPELTDFHIGEMTDVNNKTVTKIRGEMEEAKKIPVLKTRVTSDGVERKVGKSQPKERDEEEDEEDEEDEEAEKPRVTAGAGLLKDKIGRLIPIGVEKFWNREGEVRELLSNIEYILGHLKEAQKNQDAMYGEVNMTGTMGDLERAHVSIATALPYAVCTSCQGHPESQKGGCRLCLGRGMISKFRYDTLVAKETKAIVEKGVKK